MPKKGVNDKAEAAKERKDSAKRGKEAAQSKQKEDQEWADAGEGQKGKGAAKREEQGLWREGQLPVQERKKAEAAARKAEAKKLEEEEAAELSKAKGRSKVTQASRVTAHQLAMDREKEVKAAEEKKQSKALAARREVTEDSYGELVDGHTGNARLEDEVTARTLGDAVTVLTGGKKPEDRHPEKRMKAAFAGFCEARLPDLKQERPGLKQSQYQDALFKLWQKAPENPLNAR